MELVRQKNVATYIVFPIVDADGDFVSSAAGLDSEIDTFADGSAPDGFADCTNEATEIGSTGMYYLSLTQAEMNADYIVVQVKTSTSGAKTQAILIRTMVGDPLNLATTDDGGAINVASGVVEADTVKISGDTTAADNLEAACDGNTYNVGGGAVVAASVTAGVTLANDAITAAKFDESTAFPLTSADTGATAVARTGADSDTLETLSDQLDGAGGATAGAIADAVWDEAMAGHVAAGSFGKQLQDIATGTPPTAQAIREEIDANSTQLAAIVEDTGTTLPAAIGLPMQTGEAVSIATNGLDADGITAAAGAEIADAVLQRSVTNTESMAGPWTLATAVLKSTSRSRRSTDGTQVEVYRTNGTTLHATQALTPDPSGQPVLEIGTATTA